MSEKTLGFERIEFWFDTKFLFFERMLVYFEPNSEI